LLGRPLTDLQAYTDLRDCWYSFGGKYVKWDELPPDVKLVYLRQNAAFGVS